jgi:hypothetical protein
MFDSAAFTFVAGITPIFNIVAFMAMGFCESMVAVMAIKFFDKICLDVKNWAVVKCLDTP